MVFEELLDLYIKVLWQAAAYRGRDACLTCGPHKCACVGLVEVPVFLKMRWRIILDQQRRIVVILDQRAEDWLELFLVAPQRGGVIQGVGYGCNGRQKTLECATGCM